MSASEQRTRLVAILAADAARYARLMTADEAATVAAQILAARPNFTVAGWAGTQFRSDAAQVAGEMAALRSAGLP